MGHDIVRFLIRVFFRLIAHIDVYGFENLPRSGAYIVAANHVGRLDILLAYYLINRRDVIMLVAEKYQKLAINRWLVKQVDGIWLDRFNADLRALRTTLKRLRRGGVLTMAPEGTRSPNGALKAALNGASYLAAKSGVPVVPAGITGTEDAVVKARLRRLQRLHITVRFGTPFTLPPFKTHNRDAALQQYTDEIMCRIAALLPAASRGVYAEHPRLQALLREMAAEKAPE